MIKSILKFANDESLFQSSLGMDATYPAGKDKATQCLKFACFMADVLYNEQGENYGDIIIKGVEYPICFMNGEWVTGWI